MRQAAAVVAATLVVLSGAGVALAASVAGTGAPGPAFAQDEGRSEKYDKWVAPGTGGTVDAGRENDEEQQYAGKTTFLIDNHEPGATNTSFNIYAEGFSENVRMFWNVVYQEDFTWDNCVSATDAKVFGVDRGNDDAGTRTDESLLQKYESVTYHPDGIRVEFYKQEAFAGGPVNITVDDQIVSRVVNCLHTPDEPGWYRMTGYINGSTKMDATQDYTIYGAARYVYICEGCDSREKAREVLGPEPTDCPTKWGKEFVCRTEGGEYYTASDPPSGGDGARSQQTATATPTTTAADDGATPTPTAVDDAGDDPTPTPTAASGSGGDADGGGSDDQQGDGDRRTASADGGAAGDDPRGPVRTATGPVTPTVGQGPGFGALLALGALLGAAVLALRRGR